MGVINIMLIYDLI